MQTQSPLFLRKSILFALACGACSSVGGTSVAAVIEFSCPVRARTIVAYGNASQAGSPHRTDQSRLFAEKKLKPAWLTRRDVERHLERRERFV